MKNQVQQKIKIVQFNIKKKKMVIRNKKENLPPKA